MVNVTIYSSTMDPMGYTTHLGLGTELRTQMSFDETRGYVGLSLDGCWPRRVAIRLHYSAMELYKSLGCEAKSSEDASLVVDPFLKHGVQDGVQEAVSCLLSTEAGTGSSDHLMTHRRTADSVSL